LRKEILRWTDNKIDAIPFESNITLSAQFEGPRRRCLSSVFDFLGPSKDGVIETNIVINIMLHVIRHIKPFFRESI